MAHIDRLIEPYLAALLDELAAVLVVGPRAIGKTTTARKYSKSELLLDRSQVASGVKTNPDFAISNRSEPVLIDEWQVVPEVLGAIKRTVDTEYRPGRFIVTGSVRGEIDGPTWPGTGRLIRLPMYGLTISEKIGVKPKHIREIFDSGPNQRSSMEVGDYLAKTLSGGFPEAIELSELARGAFFESYLIQAFSRDSAADPIALRRYFEALAANTAGSPTEATLLGAAGISRGTAQSYDTILQRMFLVDLVPAWFSNRVKRLSVRTKRFIVDPALVAAAMRLSATSLMTDGDMLGRIVETLVYSEIRAALPLDPERPRIYHLRNNDGREVDLIVEYGGTKVFGIEIKASSTPTKQDAKHLMWLAEQLGDRFLGGIVFHTGTSGSQLDTNILALPISALWE